MRSHIDSDPATWFGQCATVLRWPCLCAALAFGLLFFSAGCATRSETSDVPLPKITQYDDNPEARAAYLQAYAQNYRARLAGGHIMPGSSPGQGDPVASARVMGAWDGMLAASKVQLQEDQEQIEKLSKEPPAK